MYNSQQVIERLHLPTSPTAAIVMVGDICRSGNSISASVDWIRKITGIETSFTDKFIAIMTAQAVVETMIKEGDNFDPQLAIITGEQRATRLRNNPKNKCYFDYGPVRTETEVEQVVKQEKPKAEKRVPRSEQAKRIIIANPGKTQEELVMLVTAADLGIAPGAVKTYVRDICKGLESKYLMLSPL